MLGPAIVTKYNGKKGALIGLEVILSRLPKISTKPPQEIKNVTK